MQERRLEPRLLCADLVNVRWKDKSGRVRKTVANLEDISLYGACLQMDMQIPIETTLNISHAKVEFQGQVRYCIYREIGYFIGVRFDDSSRWNQKLFRPQHLLDPRKLVMRATQRLMKNQPPPTIQ